MEQYYAKFLCITRRIALLGFVVRRHTQVQGISGSCGYRRLEIHFYFEDSGQGSLLIQVHPRKAYIREIKMYQFGEGKGRKPFGDKLLMSTESPYHFDHLLQVSNESL